MNKNLTLKIDGYTCETVNGYDGEMLSLPYMLRGPRGGEYGVYRNNKTGALWAVNTSGRVPERLAGNLKRFEVSA